MIVAQGPAEVVLYLSVIRLASHPTLLKRSQRLELSRSQSLQELFVV
jgi:hypothetical protein